MQSSLLSPKRTVTGRWVSFLQPRGFVCCYPKPSILQAMTPFIVHPQYVERDGIRGWYCVLPCYVFGSKGKLFRGCACKTREILPCCLVRPVVFVVDRRRLAIGECGYISDNTKHRVLSHIYVLLLCVCVGVVLARPHVHYFGKHGQRPELESTSLSLSMYIVRIRMYFFVFFCS